MSFYIIPSLSYFSVGQFIRLLEALPADSSVAPFNHMRCSFHNISFKGRGRDGELIFNTDPEHANLVNVWSTLHSDPPSYPPDLLLLLRRTPPSASIYFRAKLLTGVTVAGLQVEVREDMNKDVLNPVLRIAEVAASLQGKYPTAANRPTTKIAEHLVISVRTTCVTQPAVFIPTFVQDCKRYLDLFNAHPRQPKVLVCQVPRYSLDYWLRDIDPVEHMRSSFTKLAFDGAEE